MAKGGKAVMDIEDMFAMQSTGKDQTTTDPRGSICTAMAESGKVVIDVSLLTKHSNQTTTDPARPCIVRVPQFLKNLNTEAYVPQLVGLGPYHHISPKNASINLRGHKHKALERVIMRWHKGLKNTPQGFVDKLRGCVSPLRTEIQRCYSKNIEFAADVFILDAAFLLELCYSFNMNQPSDPFHPLLDYRTLVTSVGHVVRTDLLKLENQIPLPILQELITNKGMFEQQPSSKDTHKWFDFTPIVELFPVKVKKDIKNLRTFIGNEANPKPKHLIDYVHHCIVNSMRCQEPKEDEGNQEEEDGCWDVCVIPTAKELEKAGISFHESSGKLGFEEKCFGWKGRLYLPRVELDDCSEVMLRNMMAYEEFCVKPGERFFNRYMALMTTLIQTHADAAVLIKQKVIQNSLESNESVARLFNGLTHFITVDKFPEIDDEIVKKAKAYYDSWPKIMLHEFIQVKFGKPWYAYATIAGVVVLVCTVIQTVYAVLSS